MKILIICSGSKKNFKFEVNQIFIYQQMQVLKQEYNVEFDVFLIREKGIKGYLKNYFKLRQYLRQNKFDLLHGHYGYSGLLGVLQWKVPKVVTFHGTDINQFKNNIISSIASFFANWRIFVTSELKCKALFKGKKHSIIPCGINLDDLKIIDKLKSRQLLGLKEKRKYILFASSFNKKVKNYPLARNAVNLLATDDIELLELDGYDANEVNLLLNACDVLLMTSFSEGSPQVIKEAMACNCPVVSTDVGEVKTIIKDTKGCWITTYGSSNVAEKLNEALNFSDRTDGRSNIKQYDNKLIAKQVYQVYKEVLGKC